MIAAGRARLRVAGKCRWLIAGVSSNDYLSDPTGLMTLLDVAVRGEARQGLA
jgi:hypothetical protein